MKTIGILLPKSSTHPDIGYDFFFGLKGYFFKKGLDTELHTSNIGFGIDEDLLFSEAERMFLEKNVEILLVFAEHPKVDKIFPLASQFKKPIVVINPGAKYPIQWNAPDYVTFLSLHEILTAKVAAKFAASELDIKNGINATNFYDGGYGIADGFYLGQEQSGGNIGYNFVGKHLPADFDPKAFLDYLNSLTRPHLIYSIFTGEVLELFVKAIQTTPAPIALVCSQSMLHEIRSKKFQSQSSMPNLLACSSIDPTAQTDLSTALEDYLREVAKRESSIFSYLGWDAGLVVDQLLDNPQLDWTSQQNFLVNHSLTGSRGNLIFHPETGHFLPQLYSINCTEERIDTKSIEMCEVVNEWEELIAARAQPPQVGWFNTYLCS